MEPPPPFENPKSTRYLFITADYTDLKNKVYGIIDNVPVPFTLPEDDACKLGVTCPMKNGTNYTEKDELPVLSTYPKVSSPS